MLREVQQIQIIRQTLLAAGAIQVISLLKCQVDNQITIGGNHVILIITEPETIFQFSKIKISKTRISRCSKTSNRCSNGRWKTSKGSNRINRKCSSVNKISSKINNGNRKCSSVNKFNSKTNKVNSKISNGNSRILKRRASNRSSNARQGRKRPNGTTEVRILN